MSEHTAILEAVARGWTHEDTSSKEMDVVLGEAIVEEVAPLFDELVAALEAVEWQGNANIETSNFAVCPWCRHYRSAGHDPTCQLAASLAKAKQ